MSFDYHGAEKKYVKEEGVKLGPGAFTLPEPKRGPAFAFGDRFDGIPLDHPKLLMRRKLVDRKECHPEFCAPLNYMGNSPGVK